MGLLEFLAVGALLGLIPASIARHKGRPFGLWWNYGFFAFIVALPHALLIKGYRKCPFCAESIKAEAGLCPHCRQQIAPETTSSDGSTATRSRVSYDRSKWATLVKYDEDIARVAAELRPLGRHWVDEFAKAYLSLNDKAYVPNIVQKIVADAKAAELHGPEAEPASRPMMREAFDRWFLAARDRLLCAAQPAPASKDGAPPAAAFPKWVVPIIVGLAIGACVVLLATSGGVPPR